MGKVYYVYADYGYTNEAKLEEFTNRDEAIAWAENYAKAGLGGHNIVEVAYFQDEEYVVVWDRNHEEAEWDEDDGQPTEMEEWHDYDPDC
jgi:hypothetical protein